MEQLAFQNDKQIKQISKDLIDSSVNRSIINRKNLSTFQRLDFTLLLDCVACVLLLLMSRNVSLVFQKSKLSSDPPSLDIITVHAMMPSGLISTVNAFNGHVTDAVVSVVHFVTIWTTSDTPNRDETSTF